MRYSLKFALLLFTCIACWIAYQSNQARIRRVAMDAVSAVDGQATFYDSMAPSWLVRLVGPEYFWRIESVCGQYRTMSDEQLTKLSQIPELTSIATNQTWMGSTIGRLAISSGGNMDQSPLVTDAGIASVSKIRNLESLYLFNTAVTDDGFAQLAKLTSIKNLMIASLKITDDSIPHMSQMKSLRRFWSAGTSITPSGIDRLRQALPNCEITTSDDND